MAPDLAMIIPFDGATAKQDDLSLRVTQLVKQKGSFRGVDEASLVTELQKSQQDVEAEEDVSLAGQDSDDEEDPDAIRNNLFKEKFEGIQRLGMMAHGMRTLIDAFALSLATKSRVAENAVSAQVKQAIPTSSMENRKVAPKQFSTQAQRRAANIAAAATSEAFTNAAQRLQAASDRLKEEADRQAKYWAQLASLRAENWPVSRLPSNSKAVVVHYGSRESNPEYRNRGLAAILQANNGNMSFRGEHSSQRGVTVQILRDGRTTGKHSTRKHFGNMPSLQADLMRAREALFQNELFTEASKEARSISNMGFSCRNNSIRAEITKSLSLEVLYSSEIVQHDHTSLADDDLAAFAGEQLRLMLVAEHQHKYKQRAEQKPRPIAQTSPPVPEYALLRPLIAQLRHKIAVAPVLEALSVHKQCFNTGGLDLDFQQDTGSNVSRPNVCLTDLRLPIRSTITIKLPSGTDLVLNAETLLATPRFGTQWLATKYGTTACGTTTFPQTSVDSDIKEALMDALARDVALVLCSKSPTGTDLKVTDEWSRQLVLSRKQEKLAVLSVVCLEGRLGSKFMNLRDGSKQSVMCDTGELKINKPGSSVQPAEGTFIGTLTAWLESSSH